MSLETCSDNHAEIVYEGGWKSKCPACEIFEELTDAKTEIDNLTTQVIELNTIADSRDEKVYNLKIQLEEIIKRHPQEGI